MKVQNDSVKNMDDQIRRKINLKENELESINKIYEKKVEAANIEGDQKYVDALDRNKQKIIRANHEYEDKLKFYQSSLLDKKNIIELEENKALDLTKDKQHNLKVQSEEKYSKIYNNARENEETLFEKSRNDSKQLEQNAHHDKALQEGRSKVELQSFASNLIQNTREQEENLKKQSDNEQLNMEHLLLQNKMDTQTRLSENKIINGRIEKEQTRVQEEQIKYIDQHQADLIKQKQTDFQIRYNQLCSEHDTVLSELTAKLNKSTAEAISANVKDKKTLSDREDDPFYQIEMLKPTFSEDTKNYYVHLEVPQHEKEDVHLMAHGREIRLTMSKKYNASIEGEDGSQNRTAKTQLYSKEFPTKEIMNQKLISQKYEDGILSFKIGKL
jgi:HSP20 family molecular chaperone IbpA